MPKVVQASPKYSQDKAELGDLKPGRCQLDNDLALL